jgi:hypothetical protein
MHRATLATSVLGFAALALTAFATPSAALPRTDLQNHENPVTLVRHGHGGHGHAGHFHHRGFRFAHHRYFHGRRFVRGGVIVSGYGGGCWWLHHRAIVTGSPYWWHRYRVCRGWY